MKKWLAILGLWLSWGFALGTVLLLGPVRKSVDYARNNDWGDRKENLTVFFFMALLAVVSFLLARYSAKTILSPEKKSSAKLLHAGIPVIAAIAAVIVLMNPSLVNADGSARSELNAQFTIGPYPDPDKMKELKNEGFTALVTLLHPAVVPFEPKLLAEEQENAKKLNMEAISIPMLPWVSDNLAAIDTFRNLVKTGKGKYYIHCYLGKDRVNVARRIIEQENVAALDMEKGLAHRNIDSMQSFERGIIYKLGDGNYLSPMPTKEEYVGYVVATQFKQVVALSDPAEPETKTSNEQEAGWLAKYGILYKVFQIPATADNARMKQVADSIRQMPGPVFIHSFRSDDPIAQGFLQAYK